MSTRNRRVRVTVEYTNREVIAVCEVFVNGKPVGGGGGMVVYYEYLDGVPVTEATRRAADAAPRRRRP